MNEWFCYAIGAAILYGMHQVFTRMASDRIGDGLGGFVVEGTAALTILLYLLSLYVSGNWNQSFSTPGVLLLRTDRNLRWRRHGVFLSAVPKGRPAVGGTDDLGRRGIADGRRWAFSFSVNQHRWQRLLGIVLSIAGLFLLRR